LTTDFVAGPTTNAQFHFSRRSNAPTAIFFKNFARGVLARREDQSIYGKDA